MVSTNKLALVALCLALFPVAHASTVLLTLDANFNTDYAFYNFTDIYGVQHSSVPIGPYIANVTGGGYNNTPVYLFCYDYFSPTNVGTQYSGSITPVVDFSNPEYTAMMESTFLINDLMLDGGVNAPLAVRGAISMAIWQIMNPSSNTSSAQFPSDPQAAAWIADAANAVSSGYWSAANASLYPAWVPGSSNPSVQRFGLVIQGQTPIPEPAGLLLVGSGLLALGLVKRVYPAAA